MFQPPPLSSGPTARTNHKNVPWRAVDVNRPVTPLPQRTFAMANTTATPVSAFATRHTRALARTVTGGLTSPARLVTVGPIQSTKSGVLNAVAPSQPRPPRPSPVCSQDSTESQHHWASVYRRKKLLTESPVPERHPARPSNALNSSRSVLRIVLPNGVMIHVAGDLDGDR